MCAEYKMIEEDPWQFLKKYTRARVAMGHCGSSVPTNEMLQFQLAHAKAIDAVHLPFNIEQTCQEMEHIFGGIILRLQSAVKDRSEYLRRPDLGRVLSPESISIIENTVKTSGFDISLVIADGLSPTAIEKNIFPVMKLLLPLLNEKDFTIAPIAVVEQGRVAIADEIATLMNARLSIIFIGERPRLNSPDSMGIYMTYNPHKGITDERRNCISNVRQDGLSYFMACSKLLYLVEESFRRNLSGVELKDEQTVQESRIKSKEPRAKIKNSRTKIHDS
jgi:ethanolamine ammonia-lyase small subunit